ncbi:hypothetical protein EG68_02530 [Paragonimus skrjabini miyazakii]|uniref:Uncharacterized protein n=1 Tax=Paragonimus skrjabini miyazakii TaxID=59628 RepID=A0A8S9ZAD4_9TREM|nr:hypothetical protein EG68_02530 [Paragonimus skrjabini miyazakii]
MMRLNHPSFVHISYDSHHCLKNQIYSQFEESTNADVWNQIVKDSILGTGAVLKSALCNRLSRGIHAYGPEGFTPSVEQLDIILSLLQSEDADQTVVNPNFSVATDECCYRDVLDARKMLLASVITPQPDSTACELAAVLTDKSLLIGIYEINGKEEQARQLLCDIRDYLQEQAL